MRLLTMNIIRYAGAVLLLSAAAVTAQGPAFEVASIRPTAPDQNDVVVGVRITGAQLRISRWPLKEYLSMAYRIRPQQISGPDSLSALWDISATIPAGVSQDKVPEMLQALIADRFQMKAHLEKKDSPSMPSKSGRTV